MKIDKSVVKPLMCCMDGEIAEDDYGIPFLKNPQKLTKQVVKAYLQSITKNFDPEDESTWPEAEHAPSGHYWLVKVKPFERNTYPILAPFDFNKGDFAVDRYRYREITHYIDPSDIFQGEG